MATCLTETPEREAEKALKEFSLWASRCSGVTDELQRARDRRDNLLLVRECLEALQKEADLLIPLSHPSQFLYTGVFACPKACCLDARVEASVSDLVPGTEHNFVVVADLPESAAGIDGFFEEKHCVRLEIPDWFVKSPEQQSEGLERSLRRAERSILKTEAALSRLRQETAARQAMVNIGVLRWYLDQAGDTGGEQRLCHVTGWVTAGRSDQLQRALDMAGVTANIHFPDAPAGIEPPVSMLQAWWAQPFQLFTAMLGTPSRTEIDPSPLLALIVPLLFGYMFPDVGHGLLLIAFSALLYKRWPNGRFLIPCGLSASVFGLLYGEVFGRHDILPRIWVDPLQDPLEVLAIPMVFGAFLMLLGLVFNAIEAYWRHAFDTWLLSGAAVLLLYASILLGLFHPLVFWVSGLALIWYLLGALLLIRRDKIPGMGYAVGKLLESTFALLVNTFSFLRVGAFALAHAALNKVLLVMSESIDDIALRWLFLIAGHVLLLALEGLVVFVQTTRLVLYEFFIRFLRAEGRIFRPLVRPLPPKEENSQVDA
jgi:V/A-type H+-transporting ATPase subunit I